MEAISLFQDLGRNEDRTGFEIFFLIQERGTGCFHDRKIQKNLFSKDSPT